MLIDVGTTFSSITMVKATTDGYITLANGGQGMHVLSISKGPSDGTLTDIRQ